MPVPVAEVVEFLGLEPLGFVLAVSVCLVCDVSSA